MADIENWPIWLPQHLTEPDAKKLLSALDDFPANLNYDGRFYSTLLSDKPRIFQGDGLAPYPSLIFPEKDVASGPTLVLSNTCDVDPDNDRYSIVNLSYCRIYPLSEWERSLEKGGISAVRIKGIVEKVREQRNYRIFYLPKGAGLSEECIAFFDMLNSMDVSAIELENIPTQRIFSLSTYGHYLLAVKLGIHFSRLTDGISR